MKVRFSVDDTLGKRQLVYGNAIPMRAGPAHAGPGGGSGPGSGPRPGSRPANPRPVRLRYGNRIASVVATRQKKRDKQAVCVSRALQEALRLPPAGWLHLKQDGEVWQMGPCLGLYVTKEPNRKRMFGEQTQLLEDLTRYGQERGIDVVVLTPGWNGQQGWRYDANRGEWTACTLTMPDIIFRRSGRFHEPDAKVAADLREFQRSGRLHSLPRNSSNKWTFYRLMQESTKLRPYVPLTMHITSARELKTALLRLQDAYLKPINGAQGICIHRLSQLNPSGIRVIKEEREVPRAVDRVSTEFRPHTKLVTETLHSEGDLENFWRSLQVTFKKWVLQESVELMHTTDDRPVDFRWLVQYADGPQVTGRVARVGAKGAITTNLHTGGEAMDAKTAVEDLLNLKAKSTIADMDELAVAVVEQLRSTFGPFAEVGLDLGIDNAGRVVAFEVNPTPGRRMLRSLPDNVRELSLVTLVEYAIKAAGFSHNS